MSKLLKVQRSDDEYYYHFKCPGCKCEHAVAVDSPNYLCATWSWNRSMDKPTFYPSILVKWQYGEQLTKHVCHSYVKDGTIQFLSDCTHKLAGQTVEILEYES